MTHNEKMQKLRIWLLKRNIRFDFSKSSNSVYIYYTDTQVFHLNNAILKIGESQLVWEGEENASPQFFINSNKDYNLNPMPDGVVYDFAPCTETVGEYSTYTCLIQPDLWLPVFGDWDLKEVKVFITEFIKSKLRKED